jgi:hypothetical protein
MFECPFGIDAKCDKFSSVITHMFGLARDDLAGIAGGVDNSLGNFVCKVGQKFLPSCLLLSG